MEFEADTILDSALVFKAKGWIKYRALKWLMSDSPGVKVVRDE